ncbi:hypothetical protein ISN45_Aa06g026140, partial [Arabidopsis thaliana x Arabidopsis arenosa]
GDLLSLPSAVLRRDSTAVTRWCGEGRYRKRSRHSFRFGSGGWFEASWCRIWGARSSSSASLVLPARDPSRPK